MTDIFFALALAPVAIILWYIYKKDVHKEPSWQLAKSIIFGALAIIPVAIVELCIEDWFPTDMMSVNSFPQLFINTFIAVALVEELFKWFVVMKINYNNKQFDETYDAIVYCVFVSLGFAAIENLIYIFTDLINEGVVASLYTASLRFVTSIPGHAFFSIFMGYCISFAKMAQTKKNKSQEKIFLFASVMIPSIIHCLYDFFIISEMRLFMILWFVLLISLYTFCVEMVRSAAENNVHYQE